MDKNDKNKAADSGAFRQEYGPFDYRPECDEEKRRLDALKSHDRGDQSKIYVQE